MTAVAPAGAPLAPSNIDGQTRVDLIHRPGEIEHWVRFGNAVAETIIDRRRRALWFSPGTILAFVRWRSNTFGTVLSRIDILTAAMPGQPLSTVPGVTPGGIPLLRLAGWPSVAETLAAIDAIDTIGLDPADICPDHWRQVHHHLTARSTPRTYTLARHRAWRLRQATASC
ncbi:DUF2840 domain-containing protein [Sphingomonas donggukensis]|uniref:DUF2840 domain-containing protein n=1 Tax=Sphingomonas donggukensis TaxID=2949093 RepID=A0ABY4TV75_9SPHN|nr:DUF2840 domain-containing protein [Sphingomonas donggukensis]URW75879.1 DUF2840 domain-containing protein [Sphingomonas donggukensis]